MTVLEALLKVKKRLKHPSAWIKGKYKVRNRCCLSVAINELFSEDEQANLSITDPNLVQARKAIKNALPSDYTSIIEFNDDPSTTHKDIVKVINKAIKAEKAS